MADKNLQLIERVVTIMSFLSNETNPAGLTEISRSTGLSKTAVHRIVSTLRSHNLLLKDSHGRYQIGPGVLLWSNSYRKRSGLAEISRPYLKELLDFSGETVHLFTFENGEIYYLERFESPQPLVTRAAIGSNPPLYSTSAGKAVLSALSEDELRDYLLNTEFVLRSRNTITDPQVLMEQVEEGRRRGFYEEVEENEEGIRCVGAPICDGRGYPIGAISVSAPAYRFTDEKSIWVGERLRDVTRLISKKFGYA